MSAVRDGLCGREDGEYTHAAGAGTGATPNEKADGCASVLFGIGGGGPNEKDNALADAFVVSLEATNFGALACELAFPRRRDPPPESWSSPGELNSNALGSSVLKDVGGGEIPKDEKSIEACASLDVGALWPSLAEVKPSRPDVKLPSLDGGVAREPIVNGDCAGAI